MISCGSFGADRALRVCRRAPHQGARSTREPCGAVGEVKERVHQLHQVAHHRALAQRHQVDPEHGSPRASSAAMIGTACEWASTSTATEACGSASRSAPMRAASASASAVRLPGKSRRVTTSMPAGGGCGARAGRLGV